MAESDFTVLSVELKPEKHSAVTLRGGVLPMSLDVLFKQAVTDALEDALNKHLAPIIQRLHLPDTIPAEDASLNREQAAKYLGLSKSTLAIMASEKRGPLYYKIGRSVVYRRADLARFLEDNQCLVGRRGRPPTKPAAVHTSGSVHGRINHKRLIAKNSSQQEEFKR